MPRKKIPVVVPRGSKWCHSCQQAKPRQMFGMDRRNADGLNYCCLRCADGLNYCCLRCADGKLRERQGRLAEFSKVANMRTP